MNKQVLCNDSYDSSYFYIPYGVNSLSDKIVESFAGPHDLIGGQAWKFYDKDGNTAEKSPLTQFRADVTTAVAIPVTAPLALSDIMTSDMVEILMKLGGN
ncbi:hypothetical protein EDC44_12834 [Cricetibacter osteomyelitidis]|uniref:Uncharacterized protein n=1 Tax=Cricetibacter osteomyelitidis TaxID=1521931 RepID=A0A4R2STN3_9PAST|nr:hypothetical protein [Cricetibacter osteomyelitidis]TCP92081.1 hypothetical protein EDC44_12834 [Cricetibacter osteomyelitidis]